MTQLGITWFGGTAEAETHATDGADSCELVAVRIERTSANSRRILGEIVVPGLPVADVWRILTDYNRLAIHVPNLVESRVVAVQTPHQQPGDGAYRCRLFQKGAQKIVGFEFGASVTMDMVENILPTVPVAAAASTNQEDGASSSPPRSLQGRQILFKCYDSFFFSEFDGEWKAVEQLDAQGNIETLLSYVVDVRPKGPVPVAALEWRIREDVPTNLRAVKTAALLQAQRASRKALSASSSAATPGESLTAYVRDGTSTTNSNKNALTKRTNGTTAATSTITATPVVVNGGSAARGGGRRPPSASRMPLTPRQRQEQQAAAMAARRALRRPTISPFAKAATPPPKAQRRQEEKQRQAMAQQKTRLARFKVDWDDNETLGAYLKKP